MKICSWILIAGVSKSDVTGARQDPRRGAGRSDPAAAAKEQECHEAEH
jgi:hypothetical protein